MGAFEFVVQAPASDFTLKVINYFLGNLYLWNRKKKYYISAQEKVERSRIRIKGPESQVLEIICLGTKNSLSSLNTESKLSVHLKSYINSKFAFFVVNSTSFYSGLNKVY